MKASLKDSSELFGYAAVEALKKSGTRSA